jgi:hypothetical protein
LRIEGRSFLTEYPQLREAESEASGRLLCISVQRLATTAQSDGIRTTQVTPLPLVHIRKTTCSTAADTTATESGGISA